MAKTVVGAAYILFGSYLVYSGFVPTKISRGFFDEVGTPAPDFIDPVSFAAFVIVGLVLIGDGFLKIRACFKGGHKPEM